MRLSLRLASMDAKSCRALCTTREIARQFYNRGVEPFPRACNVPMLQFPREFSHNPNSAPLSQRPITDGANSRSKTNDTRNNSERKLLSPLVESNLKKLLESDIGSWTHQDRSLARSVLDGILGRLREEEKHKSNLMIESRASAQLLIRWMREYVVQRKSIGISYTVPVGSSMQEGSNHQRHNDDAETHIMGEYLIDVLIRLRRCLERSKSQPRSWNGQVKLSEPTEGAVQLLQTFCESNLLSMTATYKIGQNLLSDMAFSSVFSILGDEIKNNPASAQICVSIADLILQQYMSNDNTSDTIVWTCYLRVLAESSEFILDSPEKAEQIVLCQEKLTTKSVHSLSDASRSTSFSFNPNNKSYSTVLHAWANSKRSDSSERALLFLETIRSKDPSALDTICYSACIRALGQAGHSQKAEDLLWSMHQEFLQRNGENALAQPDHITFLAVIDGWARSGQPERAKALLEKMISLQENNPLYRDCLYPTTEIFTTVMSAYARHRKNSGPHVESMLHFLEQSNFHTNELCKSDQRTYMVAIQAWAKTEHPDAPDRAEAIFNRMKEYSDVDGNLMPDTITCTALIQAWAKSKRDDAPQRAMSILRRMIESHDYRAAPNTITYNMVICAYVNKGMVREAHDLLDQLIKASSQSGSRTTSNPVKERVVHPDSGTFAAVILGYSRKRSRDSGKRAHELLVQMERLLDQRIICLLKKDYNPSEAYVKTIHAFSVSKMVEEADRVLWDMVKRYEVFNGQSHIAVEPDVYVCNAVLSTWLRSNEPCALKRARRIWRWMDEQNVAGKYKNIRPNADTFKHMMEILQGNPKSSSTSHQTKELYDEVKIKYPDLLKTAEVQPFLRDYSKKNESK